jgi:flagellar protein FlbD
MITLHRLGHPDAPLQLNCDLILTIEANPDTAITLVTGNRVMVSETPDEVVELVRGWRAEIAQIAFGVPERAPRQV